MYQGNHRTVRTWRGRRIVIDLADVPFPLGNGLEVMVMYASNGKGIRSVRPSDVDEAVKVYQEMLDEYQEGPRDRKA